MGQLNTELAAIPLGPAQHQQIVDKIQAWTDAAMGVSAAGAGVPQELAIFGQGVNEIDAAAHPQDPTVKFRQDLLRGLNTARRAFTQFYGTGLLDELQSDAVQQQQLQQLQAAQQQQQLAQQRAEPEQN